jgi:DNA-binding LacI/PurR family transcriptional regulator
MAARHLLARGHSRIAFLGDNEFGFNFVSARERLDGFREVLDQAGRGLNEQDEWWIPYSSRAARELVPQILERPRAERPTALFATSDMTALGVLDGLQDAGLRAPDDLAVIGYDDLEMADWYELTTIHQPLFQSGVWAIETLLGQMGPSAPRSAPVQLNLPLRLVSRATT